MHFLVLVEFDRLDLIHCIIWWNVSLLRINQKNLMAWNSNIKKDEKYDRDNSSWKELDWEKLWLSGLNYSWQQIETLGSQDILTWISMTFLSLTACDFQWNCHLTELAANWFGNHSFKWSCHSYFDMCLQSQNKLIIHKFLRGDVWWHNLLPVNS